MPGILLSEVFFSLDLVNLVYNNNNNRVKTAVKMVVDMLLLYENCTRIVVSGLKEGREGEGI